MAGTDPSRDATRLPISTKKRPLFVPNRRHKKRRTVRRTHSPKTVPIRSTTLAPTVQGVEQAARIMNSKRLVALPTETVYTLCTCISMERDTFPSFPQGSLPPLLLLESIKDLDSILKFPKTPYAIKDKGHAPILLNEARQVLSKLAGRFWPGVLHMYMSIDNTEKLPQGLLQTHPEISNQTFVGLTCPSHPLTGRVSKQVHSQNSKAVVIGVPTEYTCAQALPSQNKSIHVLNGEDKREMFSVPPCQNPPCPVSLWVDAPKKTIHIVGSGEVISKDFVKRILYSVSKSGDALRNRVVAAVLHQWKVVSHSTTD